MPRPRILLAVALVVLAGSAAVRLSGPGWLLPSLVEVDAHIPVQVRLMEDGAAEPPSALDWGAYPHLVARLTQLLTPREDWGPPPASLGLPELLERARWPVLRVRLVVAALSLLAVPATYLLARLWLSAGWSWLAAALTGTSLLAVQFAAQARAHGAAFGLMALAVVACVRLRRRGDLPSYAVAGVAVGASIACLQSGLATLVPLAAAHAGAVREHGRRLHRLLLVPIACVALALLVFWPFLLEPTRGLDAARIGVESGVLAQAKHQVFLSLFNGLGFILLGRLLWSWEPALALGALYGAGVWLATRRRPASTAARKSDRLVVLSFVLAYAVAVGLYQRSYERFLLPLVPALAVLTAWGLARTCEAVRPGPARRALAGLLVAAVLAFPTAVVARLAALRTSPTTIDVAAAWVEEHVAPSGPRVLVHPAFALPLLRTGASRYSDASARPDAGLGWPSYQRIALGETTRSPAWHLPWIPCTDVPALRAALAHGLRAWVRDLPAELCVSEVYTERRGSPEIAAITSALRAAAERVARISPDRDPQAAEVPLTYQEETTGRLVPRAWRLLHAERLGPVIEIYRLPGAGPAGER